MTPKRPLKMTPRDSQAILGEVHGNTTTVLLSDINFSHLRKLEVMNLGGIDSMVKTLV